MDRSPVESRRAVAALRSFGRFLLVGGVNTALTFVVFRALAPVFATRPGGVASAQAIGYVVGAAFSFVANRQWTFRGAEGGRAVLVRFVVAQLGAMSLSAAATEALVTWLAVPLTPAWVIVTGVTTVLNFLVMRRWVFRVGPVGPDLSATSTPSA